MVSFRGGDGNSSQQIQMKSVYGQTPRKDGGERKWNQKKIGNELFFNACGSASHAMKCLLLDRVCVFCALQLIASRNFKNGVNLPQEHSRKTYKHDLRA